MASTTGWNSSSQAGDIGNNQISNNTSGFNAIPSGYILWTGSGNSQNNYGTYFSPAYLSSAIFWTTTISNYNSSFTTIRCFELHSGLHYSEISYDLKPRSGYSVRLVKD